MIDWVRFIVNKSLPLSSVKDNDFRKFKGDGMTIGVKMIRNVLLKMVEIAEKNIGEDMSRAVAVACSTIVGLKIVHIIVESLPAMIV